MRGYVDVHSHVVPSGDDGARSLEDGIGLCLEAARRGTRTLYATPHVWPSLPLTAEREREVRIVHARMAAELAGRGLELRLGWELTPHERLLDEDPARYRLGPLPAVLMEVPFLGGLELTERLGEHVEARGLMPVVAHPERGESVLSDPGAAVELAARGWLLQVNATSLLGYHGAEEESVGWSLLEDGHAALVGSDGHRSARPPHLDEAHRLARARLGPERADRLFDGSALEALARRDGVDLAQRG